MKRKNRIIAVLLVATLMFGISSAVLGYNVFLLSRRNRFSKNISLNNNYFLNYQDYEENEAPEYLNDGSSDEGQVEGEIIQELPPSEQNAMFIIGQVEDMYLNGILDRLTYEAIMNKAQEDVPLVEVAKYANELMDEIWFEVSAFEYKIEVPHISQVGILPNCCEAVSAAMLLHHNGYEVDPVAFVDNYLEKGEVYIKWGCRYGPDPKEAYAGDPKSEKGGWGCFAPVIAKAMNKYLDGEKLAKNLSGSSLEQLVQQYIVNDIPVAIWVTQGMEEIDKLYQWQSYDKSETFIYPVREHCMVLTGFDENYYYFNDPLSETGNQVRYEKSIVNACYNSMGKQAVAVTEN